MVCPAFGYVKDGFDCVECFDAVFAEESGVECFGAFGEVGFGDVDVHVGDCSKSKYL